MRKVDQYVAVSLFLSKYEIKVSQLNCQGVSMSELYICLLISHGP